MREPCTIAVGGHICLDIIPSFRPHSATTFGELLVPGKLLNVDAAVLGTGGAVSNTGLALHRLGMPVRLMGKVGDDALGATILSLLRKHAGTPGAEAALVGGMIVDPAAATSYTVVLNPPGIDRCFLHCPGANDVFRASDVTPGRLGDAGLFHFGYPPLMKTMYEDGGVELSGMFASIRAGGITTSLDMTLPDPSSPSGQVDWPAILARTLPQVDFFVPSVDELVYMLERGRFDAMMADSLRGVPLGGLVAADIRALADKAIALGAAAVMIKLGTQGACLRVTDDVDRLRACGRGGPADPEAWRGAEFHAPCFHADVVGTTGSGDCAIAGFLAGVVQGFGPGESLRWAVATGSASVERADSVSGVPSAAALAGRMAAGWPRDPFDIDFPSRV
ncbi:MAG: carbohydrate kinase family protein [Kiritimatiellia bacterium]|jgi:sugar/nucleoside kinase (ribokinase family)